MNTTTTTTIRVQANNIKEPETKIMQFVTAKQLKPLSARFSNTTNWTIKDFIWVNKFAEIYRLKDATFEPVNVYETAQGYNCFSVHTNEGIRPVLVHRAVYSAVKDVKLRKGQAVHHINGDKNQNALFNLQLETIGSNVQLFFQGGTGENLKDANAQEYLMDSTEEQWKTLTEYGLKVSSYGHVKTLKDREVVPTMNLKYKQNLIVGFTRPCGKHSSISLSHLVAEAWLVTPEGKFKALIKDRQRPVDELFKANNLFIPTSKKEAK